jgi:AcrR family transcriptional regulator
MGTRERRRERTRADILDAAWRLAERDGLAGFTLRDLADEVDMRAPSLYTYFDSKAAIHDAMFVQAHQQLEGVADRTPVNSCDPRGTLLAVVTAFLDFCQASVPRYQLLFTRVLPDWEPSPEAYARAVAFLDRLDALLTELGMPGEEARDLWTAMVSGLASQQVANDLDGDRWARLVPAVVDMFLHHHGCLPVAVPARQGSPS